MAADLDLIQMISGAGIMVQMVLLLLLFFSITSWAIMLIKYRYLKRAFRESALFSEFFWKSRDLSEAYKKAKQLVGSPIARVFRVGYVELNQVSRSTASRADGGDADPVALTFGHGVSGTDNVKRALRRAINTEMTRMAQMVPFLATTGNTTPVYRPLRYGLGDHELLSWHRAARFGEPGRGRTRNFRSPGGNGGRFGGSHPGGDRL